MSGILDPTKGFSNSDKLQRSSNYLIWSFKARNIFWKYKCLVTIGAKVPNITTTNQPTTVFNLPTLVVALTPTTT